MTPADRIALLTRLAGGDLQAAFASVLADRDQYRTRALAAERALNDIRMAHLKIEREWRSVTKFGVGESNTDPMSDGYWLEHADRRVAELEAEVERLRRELDAAVPVRALVERVGRLETERDRLREAGVRVGMFRFGLSRQSATEMFERELVALDKKEQS